MDTRLAIITITYNNFEELKETLDSYLHLNIRPIIIDGGSCEKTQKYCESLSDRIRYLREKDKGISDAYNKGIDLCDTPYFMLLNSGDRLIDYDYLHRSIETLEAYQNIDYVHGSILYEDELAGSIVVPPKNCRIGRGMPVFIPSIIMRKSSYKKVGPFSLNYRIAMDYEWFVRALDRGIEGVQISKKPVVAFDGAGVSSKNEWNGILECFHALKAHKKIAHIEGLFFFWRVFLFKTRKFFQKIGLKDLIIFYRKIRY